MSIALRSDSGGTSGAIQINGVDKLTIDSTGKATATSFAGDGSAITGLPTPAALSTASGAAPSYSARAWVNFNGTGTVAIRASGNVSSITDNGTGDHTVNFTTAMPDANYASTTSQSESFTGQANTNNVWVSVCAKSTTTASITARTYTNIKVDVASVDVVIFR